MGKDGKVCFSPTVSAILILFLIFPAEKYLSFGSITYKKKYFTKTTKYTAALIYQYK